MFKELVLIILSLVVISTSQVTQLNPQKLASAIENNQFTLVYFYSATCNYCKQFTPIFQKLSSQSPYKGITYAKIDAATYKQTSEKYKIYSYPTIALFWKGIDEPIFFYNERNLEKVLEFLNFRIAGMRQKLSSSQYKALTEKQKNQGIIFHGSIDSKEFNVTSVLSYVENYRKFARVETQQTSKPFLQIKGQHYDNFEIKELKKIVRKEFAQVFIIDEEPWVRIHSKKQPGIVFVDTNQNKEILALLEDLVREEPDVIFMRIDPTQEQYGSALDILGVENNQMILGVNQLGDAKFEAEKPYTKESLKAFIKGVIDLSLPLYRKTEKTTSKHKLTRANFDEKMNEKKDVMIFFYKTEDKNGKQFMSVFKTLTEQLYENENLSLLRCNLSKNQVEDLMGIAISHTPNIIFFRNRMKEHPIYFNLRTISIDSVIEFIMENTTFDWEDRWSQL